MPRNEEGEFELILGNKQLLSVFFIVVVLLGVFFVMGYILGKNSAPGAPPELASIRKPADAAGAPNPIIIDKTGPKSSAAGEPVVERPVTVEKPVTRTEAPPPPPKPEPKAEPKREERKPPPPVPVEPVPAAGDPKVGMPPSGSMFLQVAAVGRAEADVVSKVLKGKGYAIWIAPSDKEKIYRVLVGLVQKADVGKTRGALVELGFSPFPRSY